MHSIWQNPWQMWTHTMWHSQSWEAHSAEGRHTRAVSPHHPPPLLGTRAAVYKRPWQHDTNDCLEVVTPWMMPVTDSSLDTEKSCESSSITDARPGLFRRVILTWSKWNQLVGMENSRQIQEALTCSRGDSTDFQGFDVQSWKKVILLTVKKVCGEARPKILIILQETNSCTCRSPKARGNAKQEVQLSILKKLVITM